MQATKWPLTSWFLAFYLIGQAKTGISSLELKPPPWRELRHGLAAAQQDFAGDG
jgi:hypothetical protein